MGARLPDVNTLIECGLDPNTGLPLKAAQALESANKNEIRKVLRIIDEQQAIRRYKWHNLPDGLDSELMERILFYKYTGMFFYMPAENKFYFLPYALAGNIDVYGRYTTVTPLPFNGKSTTDKDGKEKAWIVGLTRKPMNDISLYEVTLDDFYNNCVIINDYCKQISQKGLPRQQLNEAIIDAEAEMIPFMRTSLMNQCGVEAVRVNNQDEQYQVMALNNQVKDTALNQRKFMAAIGSIDFQQLDSPSSLSPADYMQAMESLDNFRLQALGIDSNGLFAKKAHMLQSEQALAGGATGFILDDGLIQRQEACDKINSLWGLGIWVELSENITGDINFDGVIADEQDQSGEFEGEQTVEEASANANE